MYRLVLFAIALLLSAQALAAPQLKKEKGKVPSVAGTTWSGNSFEKQTMVIAFGKGDDITITYNNGPVMNCTWKQDGEKIYFSMNSKYCEFEGKFDGERIVGQCFNVAATRWDVLLTRVSTDK